MTGSAKTHHARRKQLRKRLRALGVNEAEIDLAVEALEKRQAARRAGITTDDIPVDPRQAAARRAGVDPEQFDAHVDAWHQANRPDDSGYKPTTFDPLARGAARVTDATLSAARRQNATTKYEHDRAMGATTDA